jgi:hypothetical protein
MMRLIYAAGLTLLAELSACASTSTQLTDPMDIALKTCGLGINTQSAYVFKVAYEVAAKKSSIEFDNTMSQSIDTQYAAILKALGGKSPDATQAVITEIKDLRSCVIGQVSSLRPLSRPELLEQCRQDVQRRISPPWPTQYGTLRAWNQLIDDKQYRADEPVMTGFFDTGGDTGYRVKAKCDIRKGRLNDVVGLDPTQ